MRQYLSSIDEAGFSDGHGQVVRYATPAQTVIHSLGCKGSRRQGGLVTPMPRLQPAAALGPVQAEARRLSVRSFQMTIYVVSARYW